jgi:hypothetical protein
MPTALGWPFLVGAGRHRDYCILLAPDFLLAGLDYGFLDEVARPTSAPTVAQARTPAGRRLTVVFATHILTADDIGASVADEHGRPLRLIYGFVSLDRIAEPAAADLRTAFDAALVIYKRFREDEDTVAVAAGRAFPLASDTVVVPTVPAAGRRLWRPATVAAGGIAVAAALFGTVVFATSPPSAPPRPSPSVSRLGTVSPPPTCAPSPSRKQSKDSFDK